MLSSSTARKTAVDAGGLLLLCVPCAAAGVVRWAHRMHEAYLQSGAGFASSSEVLIKVSLGK